MNSLYYQNTKKNSTETENSDQFSFIISLHPSIYKEKLKEMDAAQIVYGNINIPPQIDAAIESKLW